MHSISPTTDSPVGGGLDDAFTTTEAVLCAVTAKPQAGGQGIRLGFAVFDPKRPVLHVAELSSDHHLTSLEAVLMQARKDHTTTPPNTQSALPALPRAFGRDTAVLWGALRAPPPLRYDGAPLGIRLPSLVDLLL